MNKKTKRDIDQILFYYFSESHNIMLMDDDFYLIHEILRIAERNTLSRERRKRTKKVENQKSQVPAQKK